MKVNRLKSKQKKVFYFKNLISELKIHSLEFL